MSVVIRPSSLPQFFDCSRRTAGRMAPAQITDAGFTLKRLESSVGACVGTATHSAIAYSMQGKIDSGGELPRDTLAEEAGIASLDERISHEGCQFDQTTPNRNTGQKQVIRQYRSFRLHLAESITPQAVEKRIEVTTLRGNTLSGQPDLADGGIRDWKTGVIQRMNLAQLGAYSMLRRATGAKVDRLVEDFIQRVPLDKTQPPPITKDFDVAFAESVAARIIGDIEDKFEQFAATGDPAVFPANPQSVLCSAKFCNAHGTSYCREHL